MCSWTKGLSRRNFQKKHIFCKLHNLNFKLPVLAAEH
jgi:hypothetical protein